MLVEDVHEKRWSDRTERKKGTYDAEETKGHVRIGAWVLMKRKRYARIE